MATQDATECAFTTIFSPETVVFTYLSDDVVWSLVSSWLTVVDVAYLDNAHCNTALRERFICATYKRGTTFPYPARAGFRDRHCDAMNEWILRRSVSVDGIFATRSFLCNHDARRAYLQQHGHTIRWVEYASGGLNRELQRLTASDVAQYCPGLVRISAGDCVDAAFAEEIARCFPALEELQTSRCTDEALAALAQQGCKKLRRVRLACFPDNLSEEALIAFVRSFPGLHAFSTTSARVTDSVVQELASSCTALVEVELTFASLQDSSVCDLMERCKNLTRLQLRNCDLASSGEQAAPCGNVKELVLWRCGVSDAQLRDLLCTCPGLISLKICDCPFLEDIESAHLGARYASLQKLSLGGNSSPVTDAMLVEISAHCAVLRVLKVTESTLVTDAGLSAIASKCPRLEEMRVKDCPEVTGEFLAVLAQSCRALRALSLDDCAKLSDAAIAVALKAFPWLLRA